MYFEQVSSKELGTWHRKQKEIHKLGSRLVSGAPITIFHLTDEKN